MGDNKIHYWQNQRCFLNEEERENPFLVIKDFSNLRYLFDWKEELFEMFRCAIESGVWVEEAKEIAPKFWGLMQIIKLTEAAYTIYSLHETGQVELNFKRK
jgi:hypothetical protein